MTSFDELKSKALDLAQAGAAKAKELTDIAKLNIANSAEEDAIRKAYIDLGNIDDDVVVSTCDCGCSCDVPETEVPHEEPPVVEPLAHDGTKE